MTLAGTDTVLEAGDDATIPALLGLPRAVVTLPVAAALMAVV